MPCVASFKVCQFNYFLLTIVPMKTGSVNGKERKRLLSSTTGLTKRRRQDHKTYCFDRLQPAVLASASEQNQRSPLPSVIFVFA